VNRNRSGRSSGPRESSGRRRLRAPARRGKGGEALLKDSKGTGGGEEHEREGGRKRTRPTFKLPGERPFTKQGRFRSLEKQTGGE